MSDPHTRPAPAPAPDPDAVRRREHVLRRASNATRWSFAAAAAGTAALGLTYMHVLPGSSATPSSVPAPVQTEQPVGGWSCTTTTVPAPAPAQVRPAGDEQQSGESDDRAPAPTPTTTCVSSAVGSGLVRPGQPPAVTQRAPQTRTGAS